MRISVIIPAFNEEKWIAACLRSVREAFAAIRAPEVVFGVIVVDNNSTDRTAELARERGARVVFEPHNQIARARNRGAQASQADWLLFLDADSTLSAGLLDATLETIRRDNTIGGGASIRFPPGAKRIVKWSAGLWNRISRVFGLAPGSYLFCRADAFHEIGGFSEEFYCSEEIDFSLRLKRFGKQRGMGFVMLTHFPLLTSDRKERLYSWPVLLRFLFRAIAAPRKTMRDPDRCHMWYDGRR